MGEKKILVVEDDDSIRDALRELFQGEGYSVVVAENGEVGLQALKKERPRLVFLDLMMPVLDGYGFLRAMQDLPDTGLSATPVVLITAAGDRGSAGCRVNEVLTKPVDVDRLLAVAEHYFR